MNKLSDSSGSGSPTTGLFDTSLAGDIPKFLEDIKQKILAGDWFGAGEIAGQALMDGIMNIDWASVGNKIGDILSGILAFSLGFALNIDPFQLVGAINDFLGGLFSSIADGIQDLDWVDIGGKLVKALLFGVLMADPITGLLTIILSPNGDELVSGAFELIGSIIGALLSAIVGMGLEIGRLASELWTTIKDYFDGYVDWGGTPDEIIQGLWNGIKDAIKGAGRWIYDNIWIPFRDGFKEAFDINSPSKKMEDFGGNIIDGLWNGITGGIAKIKQACTDIWTAIKEKFSNVGTWFKDKFSDAWQKVKDVFSKDGKIFNGIKEGISSTFKTIVNGLIDGINKVIRVPFNSINSMLNTIRGIEVLGISPFKGLWSYNPLSIPQIPKLALGGIVNRPGRGVPAIIGEAGAEAVLPLENNTEWMDILAEKIGGNVTIPIYMDGKKIATYVVDIQKKKAFAMNGA
jgi:phage-related protein